MRRLFNTPRKIISWIIAIICLIYLYFIFIDYYTPNTGDAKIAGFTIEIAPAVDGKIEKVFVQDNQFVKEGDLLFTLDTREYEAKLKKAEASKESVLSKLTYAQTELSRRKQSIDSDLTSKLAYEKVQRDLDLEKGVLKKIEADIWYNKVQIKRAQIRAPADGFVSNLRIQKGFYAKQGELQLTLVKSQMRWIQANIKENNLERIKQGQEVVLSFGVYPGKLFRGKVKSVAKGITEYNELPNNYLSFVEPKQEWIRLAQRIPVHIELDEEEGIDIDLLCLGGSAVVTIYTTSNPFMRAMALSYHWLRCKMNFLI